MLGAVLVASAAAMFGTLSYITRSADALGMGALPFVWWRGVLGTVVMLVAFGLLTMRSPRVETSGATWRPTGGNTRLVIACVLASVVNIAMFLAFLRMTIAVALITFYTFPALVTILAVRLYGERLSPVRAAALLLSAAGLVLVLLSPVLTNSAVVVDPIGIGLAIGSALCQATFILMAGRGFGLTSARVGTYVLFVPAVVAFALAFASGDVAGLVVPFHEPQAWTWIVLGGITGAAVPSVAFLTGIGLIGPSRAAILMTIEPLVGVSLAAALLGERPSPLQIAGGVAVLAAAIILQLVPSRVTSEPEFSPLL